MSPLTEEEALAFRDFTAEELAEYNKYYNGSGQPECMRVGPKGYVLFKVFKDLASDIYNMPLRSDDVFITSYMRSGTTLTQELVWLLANDLNYEKAKISLWVRYRLLEMPIYFHKESHDRILQMSENTEKTRAVIDSQTKKSTQYLAEMPFGTPRFIKTHLPISLLPPKLIDTAKVVYVARDPRDVFVSGFHLAKLFTKINYKGEFKQMWNSYKRDFALLTPYFEHVKEAWALKDHPNMLFLFYEDLLKDLEGSIRRVAAFLGKEVNCTFKMKQLCEHLTFDNFKKNNSINLENMRDAGVLSPGESFIRKGKSGGWRDYFDEEMAKEAEQWMEENLRDTDLRFPSFQN